MVRHSSLSASAAHRWLNCPKSVALSAQFPDAASSYAAEGTIAHELCAYKLGQLVKVAEPEPKGEFDSSTVDCADGYVAFVAEHLTEGSKVLIEQKVDYSEYVDVPESYGIADCVVLGDETLTIIDYKHGVGVPVSAEYNPQLMLYALGAYSSFADLYVINKVRLCIYQPRISNISTFEIALDELLRIAKEEFAPKAKLAKSDEGEFSCGDWCRFCKAKNVCRARAEANLAQARLDFPLPPTLSDTEITVLLDKVDGLIKWATDIKDYAFDEALNHGKQWKGYKLVAGRSTRKYKDENKVAEAVKSVDLDPYEHKVLGVTAMTKLLGKKKFDELLSDLIFKADGKPTLVTESDKRPELKASAQDDFTQVN